MLAFYTIKTTVDIVANTRYFDAMLWAIGNLCQPDIVGTPFEEEDGVFIFRFAVRPYGLDRAGEHDVISTFGEPFNNENTQLVLASRL